MRFRRNRSSSKPLGPDLEKGPSKFAERDQPRNGGAYARGKKSTDGDPRPAGVEQTADDDSDNNDKFWKLFQEEAAAEAKWKVGIWKTELDSLLVFAGLFAAVVSAFLIDLRLHLRPDPQLIALNQIISILNNTGPIEFDKPTLEVRAVGFLWYGSLVATLIGALWGVLAKGWLGEILREPRNNPADRALERWRRDRAAKNWHMDSVMTAVPLLTQIGLAMFLSGFVVQSFGDNHVIGLEVLAYVLLGAFAYALFTIIPWYRPECPYRTPLTNFFHLVPTIAPTKDPHDADTDSKIKILVSRLNRSSNDEIFCSAAAILDAKLESHDSKKWYRGVEKQASGIAEALSVRLKSFSHRVQQIADAPSLSILKDTASSGISTGQAIMGNFYSPTEQGIACLRVLLKSMEAGMSTEGNKSESPWIKQDMDRQWRLSKIFPETWRLLSLSIHITKLVAKEADYDTDDIAESDWENMIRATFSDLTLRSISGASACRGLLHGKENLQRLCALGLAMFIEVEVTTPTDSPKQMFIEKDSDPAVDAGKIITEKLWSELVKIWKNTVGQLLLQTRSEGEEENTLVKLLDHDLYQNEIKASIDETILVQLESENWTTRKQAVRMLIKLAEHDLFREAVYESGSIAKVIAKVDDKDEDVRTAAIRALSTFSEQYPDTFTEIMKKEGGIVKLITTVTDDDSDVRAAAVDALLEFSKDESYQPDVESSIPAIIKELDNEDSWRLREQSVRMLMKLAENDEFQEALNTENIIPQLVAKLEDNDSDVRAAANEAVLALSTRETYQNNVKPSIPTIMKQLDHDNWSVREKTVQLLIKLAEPDTLRETMNTEGLITNIVGKIGDGDSDVRAAAVTALRVFSASTYDPYHSQIESSIPIMIKQLDNESWTTRREAIRVLIMLSENAVFQETIKTNGVITKFIVKLDDDDEDVRVEAIRALVALAVTNPFKEVMNSENIVPKLFDKLSDNFGNVRFAAIQAMSTLSMQETYNKEIKPLISITSFVKQLQDESWSNRQQAIQNLSKFATNVDFQAVMNTEKTVPKLASMLIDDRDEDVRTAAAEALSVFGVQEMFQKIVKSEKIIPKLIGRLSDSYGSVRSAAQKTLLTLGEKAWYQNDMKSAIPAITKQLEDQNWATRQLVIQMFEKLSERPAFQEIMKTEMSVGKLVGKLVGDRDEDVRAAAARALSVLGTKGPFKERMKTEKAIPKLVSKLMDDNVTARSAVYDALLTLGKQEDATEFLPTVMSTLHAVEEPVRTEVYKLLKELKAACSDSDAFVKEIDTAICKFLTQMTQKDLSFISQSIAILMETADEGLRGYDLKEATATNKPARDAVETIVKTKLIYDKNLPDRGGEVVLALSRLAKHDVFLSCTRAAIPGLTEAVGSNDRNVWNNAIAAVSALSSQDEFRTDLIPSIQKLVQQLNSWDEDEAYPLNLVQAMSSLVEYKEFRAKLKYAVPILMNLLSHSPKDVRGDIVVDQDNDKNEVPFYKVTCKLVSDLCEIEAVGRELVPQLTRVLSNMDATLTEDLLHLVTTLVNYGRLTMNDRIALASSLRISSPVQDTLEVQVCKLNMAALLDEAHKIEHPFSDYSLFFGAVLGNGNTTVKSKLSTLMPPPVPDSKSEVDST